MNKTTILIVEDEEIVAADLATKLEQLGYEVIGTAARGKETIELACRMKPDVVLLDFRLTGAKDGIETAESIRHRHFAPVIYLTANTDSATLDRAEISDPFAYVLQTCEEKELSTAIEMALYKHKFQRHLHEQREWLRGMLTSIGDAVITCDNSCRVTFLNPTAEALTSWRNEEAREIPIQEVFRLINEQTRQPTEDPVAFVLREGCCKVPANHTALVTRDGREIPIEDSAAPIQDADGLVIGVVLVFHDVTEKRRAQEALLESESRLKSANFKLQVAIEELQAKSEELQAQNEELHAQNEELALLWDESRRSEEALALSQERLNLALNSSGMATFDWDIIANIRTWDANVHRLLGTNPETFTGAAEEFFRVIHPDDKGSVKFALSKAIENTGEYTAEYRAIRPDGTIRHIAARGKVHRDNAGRADRMTGICWDITDRKISENVLKKLNEELENRVEERTEELATSIERLQIEIEERENAEERVLRLNRLYLVLSETNQAIVRTKDRNSLFNEFCRIAVEDGGFKLAWVGLVAEESGELKMIAAKGATGYLEEIRITGNEEPEGFGPTGVSIREGTFCICNDFLGSQVTSPWHQRGRTHGIRASASIALKQGGRVIGALTLYADKKDFFDREQVELLWQMGSDISFALDNIVRETLHREAELALREETTERLRAMEALREKEQMLLQQSRQAAMGEMIGNIAHQWRQPLNALGLTIQQLLLFYDHGEFTREFLDKSVLQSMEIIKHMSLTIDDFRNYFRPDKEKVEFKVCDAMSNTLSLIEDSFKSQHISHEIVAMDDPVVYGYRNEFAQALLNILNNARDALKEREIIEPKVTITVCNEGGCAVITVADNAGGIPEEIMGKIFDPYFTTKGPQEGTGVGLFMSKTIIEKNMGGKLAARNTGVGAEFRIEV
jgi:PAS domain S-box-containing protein